MNARTFVGKKDFKKVGSDITAPRIVPMSAAVSLLSVDHTTKISPSH